MPKCIQWPFYLWALECVLLNALTAYCSPSCLSYRERPEEHTRNGGQSRWTVGILPQICSRQGGWRWEEKKRHKYAPDRVSGGGRKRRTVSFHLQLLLLWDFCICIHMFTIGIVVAVRCVAVRFLYSYVYNWHCCCEMCKNWDCSC